MYPSSSSFRNLLYRSLSQVSASSRTVISQGDCYQLHLHNCISQFVMIILYVYVFLFLHVLCIYLDATLNDCVVVVLQENVDSFASLNFLLLIFGRRTSINGLLWIFFSSKFNTQFYLHLIYFRFSFCFILSCLGLMANS